MCVYAIENLDTYVDDRNCLNNKRDLNNHFSSNVSQIELQK